MLSSGTYIYNVDRYTKYKYMDRWLDRKMDRSIVVNISDSYINKCIGR